MDLNEQNYYSKRVEEEYMSYSQFKDFDKCPAYAMAKIKGEWQDEESDALLVGSYIDSWLDGELDKFREKHPEIFNSITGELKAKFKQANDICRIIEKDEYLYSQLKGKRQVIITGNIASVQFKGKIDSLLADVIVDGKVLKDCEDVWLDGKKQPFYMAQRYDLQSIIYKTLYKQQTGKDLPFRLAVVTKEKTPDKKIFEFKDETLQDALQEIICKAPIFDLMKKGVEPIYRCEHCEYCKATKQLSKDNIEYL